MTRTIMALAFIACTLAAWGFSARYVYAQASVFAGGDTLELSHHGTHAAALLYSNSGYNSSKTGQHRLCIDVHGQPLCVVALVQVIPGQFEERLTVTAPEGFIAVPDMAEVKDGEAITVFIVPPMF